MALRVLGLGSWLVSELRVARGLATGAVESSEESLVHRRVNCSVGPWEKLSNGGKRYKQTEAVPMNHHDMNVKLHLLYS